MRHCYTVSTADGLGAVRTLQILFCKWTDTMSDSMNIITAQISFLVRKFWRKLQAILDLAIPARQSILHVCCSRSANFI